MSAFVSFPLFEFTLATKLRNLDFESHWKTWIVYDEKKDMVSDLNMPTEKCLILFHFHCLGSLYS